VVRWKKITLVGVGLLGGSLGLALKERKLAERVVGFVRRKESLRECVACGAVDAATLDILEAVREAQLVVLCTPIAQIAPLVKQMLPALPNGAIVTDVGSVKASVVRDIEKLVAKAGAHFIGSHPMAGAEKTGVGAAKADLFVEAACVVTPTTKSSSAAVKKVEQLWKSVGARVMRLTPEIHDDLVSRSSHLPHVVAATLANSVLAPNWPKPQAALCANGFRDTTRVASGSPEMWRDIALANRKNLARALKTFINDLRRLETSLKNGEEAEIMRFLEQAKQRRDDWVATTRARSPE